MMMIGHGAIGLEGEWLFKASLVVLTTKLVSVSCLFFHYLREEKSNWSHHIGSQGIIWWINGAGNSFDRRKLAATSQGIFRRGWPDFVSWKCNKLWTYISDKVLQMADCPIQFCITLSTIFRHRSYTHSSQLIICLGLQLGLIAKLAQSIGLLPSAWSNWYKSG